MSVRRYAKALCRRVRQIVHLSKMRGATLLSYIERRDHVIAMIKGAAPATITPRVAILCHFDPDGRVHEPTRVYLEALLCEGLSVVFVTNSGRLAEPDLAWVNERAIATVIRRNV